MSWVIGDIPSLQLPSAAICKAGAKNRIEAIRTAEAKGWI
jgi:hypothetical protein